DDVVAGGSDQASATLIDKDVSVITGSGGVRLPLEQDGVEITLANKSGSPINVYPPKGGKINSGAVDAPYSLTPGPALHFTAHGATQDKVDWLTSLGAVLAAYAAGD